MKSPQKIDGYIFGKAVKHMHQKPDKWGAFDRQGTVKCLNVSIIWLFLRI